MGPEFELNNIIQNLGKYQKTLIETSYPLLEDGRTYSAVMECELVDVYVKPVNFPPECIVTFLYDKGTIVFSAFCVPLKVLAQLTNPTFAPNYKEDKDFPYASFIIDDIEFRIISITTHEFKEHQ